MPEITARRKRPVEVRTLEWDGSNLDQMLEFCGGGFRVEHRFASGSPAIGIVFDRLHDTWIKVFPGQHVVNGVRGEFYPIEEQAMDETYEPLEAAR